MLLDSALESLEDFTSMENIDENLLNTFLDFDFDFSEEIRTTSRKFNSMPIQHAHIFF